MNKYLSDKLKIISFGLIVFVVFLHSYNLDVKIKGTQVIIQKSYVWVLQNLISYGFTRVAVPLFFLISGYLFFFNHDGTKATFYQKIYKRFQTLFIPFIFWSLFGILFYFILQSIPQLQSLFNKSLIKDYTFFDWINTVFVQPIPYQLWFIRDLIILVCVSPLIFYLIKWFWQIPLIVAFVLWGYDFDVYSNSIEAFLFFYIGSMIGLKYSDRILIKKKYSINSIFFLWFSVVVLKVYLQYIDYSNWVVYLLFKLSILVGIFFVWYSYDKYEEKLKTILNYTLYTFFIYASHEPILTIYKKLLFFVLGKEDIAFFITYIFAPLFTIITALVVGHILKSFVPTFYKTITGNR